MPLLSIRRHDWVLLLASLGSVILYAISAWQGGFPLDDSWIHQVYGRNLAQLGEWSFVRGVPSAASTSPLYTVLLSIGYRLGIPYPLWTHGLGAFSLFLAAMMAARMGERVMPSIRWAGLLIGLAVALCWHLIWAAASGMETMLFSMLTVAVMFRVWGELDDYPHSLSALLLRGGCFGLLAGLITLARPEGLGLVGLAALLLLIVRPGGHRLRSILLFGGAAFVIFAGLLFPYLAMNYQVTGGFLPDTAAAKQVQVTPLLGQNYLRRVFNLFVPIMAGGQVLLLPGVIVYLIVQGRRTRHERAAGVYLLPVLWIIALLMLYAARLPAAYQHGRYVIPALPALLIIGVSGTVWIIERGRSGTLTRVLSRALAMTAVLVFIVFGLVLGPNIYATDVDSINNEMVASALWIRDNVPQDALLAVHDIGAVGYFTPERAIFDIAGLVNPEVIPLLLDADALWAAVESQGAEYLLAFPNQIPGQDPNDARLCPLYTPANPDGVPSEGYHMTIYRLDWDHARCES